MEAIFRVSTFKYIEYNMHNEKLKAGRSCLNNPKSATTI